MEDPQSAARTMGFRAHTRKDISISPTSIHNIRLFQTYLGDFDPTFSRLGERPNNSSQGIPTEQSASNLFQTQHLSVASVHPNMAHHQQPPATAICTIPEELLLLFFKQIAYFDVQTKRRHYQDIGPVATLRALCVCSKQFYRIAQPLLFELSDSVLTRPKPRSGSHQPSDLDGEHESADSVRDPSVELLFLRTLLLRGDLLKHVKRSYLNFSGEPGEHVKYKALTHGYLGRVFDHTSINAVRHRWGYSRTRWSRMNFHELGFPKKLILDLVDSPASRKPLSWCFNIEELRSLVHQAYSLQRAGWKNNLSLPCQLLRSIFEDDPRGVNVLLLTLVTHVENLWLASSQMGTMYASNTLESISGSRPTPLSHSFTQLRTITLNYSGQPNIAAGVELSFLTLPSLRTLAIQTDITSTQALRELPLLVGKSPVVNLLLTGNPVSSYLQQLLPTFKALETLSLHHEPDDFQDLLHLEVMSTLLRAAACQIHSLRRLHLHCTEPCADCLRTHVDFSAFTNLRALSVDSQFIGIPLRGFPDHLLPVGPPMPITGSPDLANDLEDLAAHLPASLERLDVAYIPWMKLPPGWGDSSFYGERTPEIDVTDAITWFAETIGTKSISEHKRSRMPALRCMSLKRLFHRPSHHNNDARGTDPVRWKEAWEAPLEGYMEMRKTLKKLGIHLHVRKRVLSQDGTDF